MIIRKDEFEEAECVAERINRRSVRDNDASLKKTEAAAMADAEPTEADNGKTIFELELARPLGLILKEVSGYGVFVEALTNGSAASAGVRRGDRIVATGSTFGNMMWEKNTLDGILASVNSGALPPPSKIPNRIRAPLSPPARSQPACRPSYQSS
jgi:predicted metalloprotease with PDZ domain